MNEFLGKGTIYIGDSGDVVTISAQAVRPRNPGKGSGVLSVVASKSSIHRALQARYSAPVRQCRNT
ncbi:hypothetical protein DBR37_16605 [Herminiimonas sp. KBW02]|nr:hypothetical protein DBR37_16605 [Herminiimonas sp. KBW02]